MKHGIHGAVLAPGSTFASSGASRIVILKLQKRVNMQLFHVKLRILTRDGLAEQISVCCDKNRDRYREKGRRLRQIAFEVFIDSVSAK